MDPVAAALRPFAEPPSWLTAAADGERVAAALRSAVPELDGRLTGCRVEDLRLTGRRWVGRYVLRLVGAAGVSVPPGSVDAGRVVGASGANDGTGGPGSSGAVTGAQRTVVLTGVLGPDDAEPAGAAGRPFAEGWHVDLRDPPLRLTVAAADRKLRALPLLTEPLTAREWLAANLQAAFPGIAIAECDPTVVRYRPNQRCTVVQRLHYVEGAPGSWPAVVVTKAHRSGEGAHADGALRALAAAGVAASRHLVVARSLAYVPADDASVQSHLPQDRSLVDLIQHAAAGDAAAVAEAEAALRTVAQALAELHRLPVEYGSLRVLADELAGAHAGAAKLGNVSPALGGAVQPLLRLVEAAAGVCPPDAAAPSHGAFRPAQVRLAGDRVGLLDLDGFGRCEPAQDLGRFVGKLRLLALLAHQPGVADGAEVATSVADRLAGAFVEQYCAQAPVSPTRVTLWECLDLLKTLQQSWSRVRPAQCEPVLRLLDSRVALLRG